MKNDLIGYVRMDERGLKIAINKKAFLKAEVRQCVTGEDYIDLYMNPEKIKILLHDKEKVSAVVE